MSAPDCHVLWHVRTPRREVRCQVMSCCSGAELQVIEDGAVTIRELYPDKSDLYERAWQLKAAYEDGAERTGS